MRIRSLLAATAVAMLWSTCAMAGVEPLIVVDEFGHGSFQGQTLPSAFLPDGGVQYLLPFVVNSGVVQIMEPAATGEFLSDLIDFSVTYVEGVQRSVLTFYSDGSDGLDAPADVRQLPPLSVDWPRISEIGPEGNNYADYFPGANEPGGNADGVPSYRFISDSPAVPLPGAAWMGMALLGGLAALRRRAA